MLICIKTLFRSHEGSTLKLGRGGQAVCSSVTVFTFSHMPEGPRDWEKGGGTSEDQSKDMVLVSSTPVVLYSFCVSYDKRQ